MKKRFSPTALIIIGLILTSFLALLIAMPKNNNTLPTYTETVPEITENKIINDIQTETYFSESPQFTMEVPVDWTYVLNNNSVSFVNPADGATIEFIVQDYYPEINNMTEETLTQQLVDSGGIIDTYLDFSATSNIYVYHYNDVYCEEYMTWDKETVIVISCRAAASDNTDTYIDFFSALLDTFSWQQDNPIPEDIYLYYSSFGNFEFGVPTEWESYLDNGYYVAVSPSGSYIYYTASQFDGVFSDISQDTLAEIYLAGYEDYQIAQFQNDGQALIFYASYLSDGVVYNIAESAISSNGYLYEITFISPQIALEADYPMYEEVLGNVRLF